MGYNASMAALVLGGEASMWGDDVNADIFDAFVWRGVAALAERLWSPVESIRNPVENFGPVARLADHSCRLRIRGLGVGPTFSGWCPADVNNSPDHSVVVSLRQEVQQLRE